MRKLQYVFVLVAVVCLMGCENRLTAENFAKVSEGMTKEEVLEILGPPDTTNISTIPGAGRIEHWYYANGNKTAAVGFSGDTVESLGSTDLHGDEGK
jgi:outer membrane protein assembly factor BamE (lipoprotein component of BamABCDE complex)